MAIKKINQWPDEVLKSKCVHVQPRKTSLVNSVSDEEGNISQAWPDETLQFIEDLTDTVKSIEDRALGLAAPQIWDKPDPCPAIFVMRWPTQPQGWKWAVIINPKIKTSGKKVKHVEGCLSLQKPAILLNKKVRRRANTEITFQTVSSANVQTVKFYGHLGPYAQIIQHECDHLNGKMCIHK